MYGIVEIGGHQYRVQPGEIIDIEKIEVDEGGFIDMDKVLFIGGEHYLVGGPLVEGAVVKAKVIRHARGKKVLVFKRRPGQWKKKRGHRQSYTALLITEIHDGQGKLMTIDKESKNAKKYLA